MARFASQRSVLCFQSAAWVLWIDRWEDRTARGALCREGFIALLRRAERHGA